MAENNTPQNLMDDELSVEELEQAAGGHDHVTNTCPITNFNCPAPPTAEPTKPGIAV